MKKTILKIMLGSIIAEVVLVCLFILTGEVADIGWQAMSSVACVFYYAIPCLIYSRIYDDERYKNVAVIGSVLAGIAALLSIFYILDAFSFTKGISIINTLVWLTASIAWILSYPSVNNLLARFKVASISFGSLVSLFIIFIILTGKYPEDFMARLFFVLIVLTVGSYISTLIITRIYKKEIAMARFGNNELEQQSVQTSVIPQGVEFNLNNNVPLDQSIQGTNNLGNNVPLDQSIQGTSNLGNNAPLDQNIQGTSNLNNNVPLNQEVQGVNNSNNIQ